MMVGVIRRLSTKKFIKIRRRGFDYTMIRPVAWTKYPYHDMDKMHEDIRVLRSFGWDVIPEIYENHYAFRKAYLRFENDLRNKKKKIECMKDDNEFYETDHYTAGVGYDNDGY